jgi:Ca2+-binding RTX toxin-like protein
MAGRWRIDRDHRGARRVVDDRAASHGNDLAQTIAGTAGADAIGGHGGRYVLIGGAGADTFVIGTVAIGSVAVLAD